MNSAKRPRITPPVKLPLKAPSINATKPGGRKDVPAAPARVVGTEHDSSCPCDWARFLPAALISPTSAARIESLPASGFVPGRRHPQKATPLSQAEHDRALEDYFTHVASWQMRVVPKLFFRDMRSTLSVTPRTIEGQTPRRKSILHYSPALHCALLADAGKYSPPDSVSSSHIVRRSVEPSFRSSLSVPLANCSPNRLASTSRSSRRHRTRASYQPSSPSVSLASTTLVLIGAPLLSVYCSTFSDDRCPAEPATHFRSSGWPSGLPSAPG